MYFASNRTASGPAASFEAEIRRRIAAGDTRSMLYIVPTGAQSRDLINRITETSGGKALMLPQILSLSEFVTRLRSAVRPDLELISPSQSAALIELAMRTLFARTELEYFEQRQGAGLPVFSGTFDEIVASINALKEQGIRDSVLLERLSASAGDSSERRKLRDIAAIYREYDATLGARSIDQYGQYFVLTNSLGLPAEVSDTSKIAKIADRFASAFPDVRDVFVAPFVRFAEPVLQLLLSIGMIPNLAVSFALDFETGNPDLFRFQEDLRDLLESRGYRLRLSDEPSDNSITGFRRELRRTLFKRTGESTPFDGSGFVSEFVAPTLEEEVRIVARKLKTLVAATGAAAYGQVAVASTDQELYAPVVQSIFSEYGIPFQLTHRTTLTNAPVFHGFESLLELGVYKLSRRRVRSVLESPYFAFVRANGVPLEARSFLHVLGRYHFPQGASEWHSAMDELIGDLEGRLGSEFDDENERRTLEHELSDLREARTDILIFERLAERMNALRTPAQFVGEIQTILSELGVVRSMLASSEAMIAAGELETETRGYAALLQLLDELLTLTRTLGLAETKLGPAFYLERIRTAATRLRIARRAEPGSAVVVTSFDQLAGNEYEHVFLIGLRDGLFPLAFRRSLFLPQEYSTTHDAYLVEQRYSFYQTLSCFRSTLTLGSHSGAADGSRAYNRSSALDALLRVVRSAPTIKEDNAILAAGEFYKQVARPVDWSSPASVSSVVERADAAGMAPDALQRMHTTGPAVIGAEVLRRRTPDSVYSGVLAQEDLSDEERQRLEDYRERVYSITQLETYAACGFKYFCTYVLAIEAPDGEPEEGLDSAEQGSILHKSLYTLLERFREQGLDIRRMGDSAIGAAREIVGELYPDSDLRRLHPFARLDRTRLFESDEMRKSAIERFITAEQRPELRDITAEPRYFELAFGATSAKHREGYPDPEPPVEIDGIKLRGKIDRIDMDDSGNFVVIDYKSGAGAPLKKIADGLSLQLPLYLRIAEDLLRTHLGDEGVRGVGALYHALKESDKPRDFRLVLKEAIANGTVEEPGVKKKKFESVEELEAFIERVVSFAKEYVEGIAGGNFRLVRADRRNESCRFCQYQSVCRVAQAEADGVLPPKPALASV